MRRIRERSRRGAHHPFRNVCILRARLSFDANAPGRHWSGRSSLTKIPDQLRPKLPKVDIRALDD